VRYLQTLYLFKDPITGKVLSKQAYVIEKAGAYAHVAGVYTR
jgi:hypothetical protein